MKEAARPTLAQAYSLPNRLQAPSLQRVRLLWALRPRDALMVVSGPEPLQRAVAARQRWADTQSMVEVVLATRVPGELPAASAHELRMAGCSLEREGPRTRVVWPEGTTFDPSAGEYTLPAGRSLRLPSGRPPSIP